MDVSCIFVRRDNNYYDFKPEIENKNQIKDYLGTRRNLLSTNLKDGGINIEFYKDTDTKLKESEELLWNYLKEIGHDN